MWNDHGYEYLAKMGVIADSGQRRFPKISSAMYAKLVNSKFWPYLSIFIEQIELYFPPYSLFKFFLTHWEADTFLTYLWMVNVCTYLHTSVDTIVKIRLKYVNFQA